MVSRMVSAAVWFAGKVVRWRRMSPSARTVGSRAAPCLRVSSVAISSASWARCTVARLASAPAVSVSGRRQGGELEVGRLGHDRRERRRGELVQGEVEAQTAGGDVAAALRLGEGAL